MSLLYILASLDLPVSYVLVDLDLPVSASKRKIYGTTTTTTCTDLKSTALIIVKSGADRGCLQHECLVVKPTGFHDIVPYHLENCFCLLVATGVGIL